MTTPSKEALLHKLNAQADADYQKAAERAERLGKPRPSAPSPLEIVDLEFPKYLHKGWKPASKVPGHLTPEESELAHNAEQAEALLKKGFSEAPPKALEAEHKHEAHPKKKE